MWGCIEQLPQCWSLFLHPAPKLHEHKWIFHSLITQEARVIIWPLAIKREIHCDLISYFSSIHLSFQLQPVYHTYTCIYVHMYFNLFSFVLWQPQVVWSTILLLSSNIMDAYLLHLLRWHTVKAAVMLTLGKWHKR